MPADAVIENYEGGSAVEEIAENFELPVDQVRTVLACAVKHNPVFKP